MNEAVRQATLNACSELNQTPETGTRIGAWLDALINGNATLEEAESFRRIEAILEVLSLANTDVGKS